MDEYRERVDINPLPLSQVIPFETLRWIAMPFAAAVGAFAASILVGMLIYSVAILVFGLSKDGWFLHYIGPFIISFVFANVWSRASGAVSPRSKDRSASLMSILLCILIIGCTILAWQKHSNEAAKTTVIACATVAGSLWAALIRWLSAPDPNNIKASRAEA